MPILSFVIGPWIAQYVDLNVAVVRWMSIIVGLIWLFVFSMIILRRELGTLQWSVIRKRMWYQTPRDPKTGEPKLRLLWWALPAALLNGIVVFTILTPLHDVVLNVFPSLRPWVLKGSDLFSPQYVGQWWMLGVMFVSNLFNHFLGEEFLFRGVLLPKMKGVFGRWDWLMNLVLFSFYHWDQPWGFVSVIATFIIAGWASRRYQCNWIFYIAHGIDGIFLFTMLLLFVSGIAS
ncbi:type II CAAX prenyl endopeptidase Rce1 family protein [Chloroflexota bacterium]